MLNFQLLLSGAKMKTLVITITGASASIRKRKDTLPEFIEDVIKGQPDIEPVFYNVFSSDSDCVEKAVRRIWAWPYNILLIGKSLGGVRAWWAITHYWERFKLKLDSGQKFGVVLIDPHGPQKGDKRAGWYGVSLQTLRMKRAWNRKDMKISCVYQRNKAPKGAHLPSNKFARNKKLNSKADHWNITQIDTGPGQTVAKEINKTINWIC